MLGLKRGEVFLCPHEKAWETEAQRTISRLWEILGNRAKDIQHVGSTAVPAIKAKPIIDIAVAVDDFQHMLSLKEELEKNGFYYRPCQQEGQLLFACGSCYDGSGELQPHFIHVTLTDSPAWNNYINFRDYLNHNLSAAKAYESVKVSMSEQVTGGCVGEGHTPRQSYTAGKHDFITDMLCRAQAYGYLGKMVYIKIDRPAGSCHPEHKFMIYPLNYGFIPGTLSGDGEALDVYLLGVREPVEEYTARVIAVIHRYDDVEDKLVAAPEGMTFTKDEIKRAVEFQEQYFNSEVIV